jgi:thiol-disulfide isomerase/thioredoxin
MKKLYFLLFILALSVQLAIAQIPAKDFTVTDTDGGTHSLFFDYLDEGKTVVIDLFFVDCPPCNELAPLMEPLYQEWGAGSGEVQFLSLSPKDSDSNAKIEGYKQQHDLTFPGAGYQGNAPAAVRLYNNGTYGPFYGYPTLVVVAPDRSVQYDIWDNNSMINTVALLDVAIENTGAQKFVNATIDPTFDVHDASLFPNPAKTASTVTFTLEEKMKTEISVIDLKGKIIGQLYQETLPAGGHEISLPMQELPIGNYALRILTDKGGQVTIPFTRVD